jgi:hypothetical protein
MSSKNYDSKFRHNYPEIIDWDAQYEDFSERVGPCYPSYGGGGGCYPSH